MLFSGHFVHILTFFTCLGHSFTCSGHSLHVQSMLQSSSTFYLTGSGTEHSPTPTWYRDLLPEDCAVQMQLSGKVMFLLELLKEVEKIGEKILVFSQSLCTLNMIEEMVQLPECGSMIEGIHYFRLDGSTKADDRRKSMNRFNRKGLESDRLEEISGNFSHTV